MHTFEMLETETSYNEHIFHVLANIFISGNEELQGNQHLETFSFPGNRTIAIVPLPELNKMVPNASHFIQEEFCFSINHMALKSTFVM